MNKQDLKKLGGVIAKLTSAARRSKTSTSSDRKYTEKRKEEKMPHSFLKFDHPIGAPGHLE